jgi:hypothetical protein
MKNGFCPAIITLHMLRNSAAAPLTRTASGLLSQTARPHQGLGQDMSIPRQQATTTGPVQRRKVLGFISDHH